MKPIDLYKLGPNKYENKSLIKLMQKRIENFEESKDIITMIYNIEEAHKRLDELKNLYPFKPLKYIVSERNRINRFIKTSKTDLNKIIKQLKKDKKWAY